MVFDALLQLIPGTVQVGLLSDHTEIALGFLIWRSGQEGEQAFDVIPDNAPFLMNPGEIGLNLLPVKQPEDFVQLSFTTPIDIFLKPVVKGLIRYSGILFCHLFNTSSKA